MNGPADELELQYLAQMSPEQRLAAFSPFADQQAILQQQIAQAQALQQRRPTPHSTAGGAILGGLGDIMGSVAGTLKERDLRGQEQKLLGDKQSEASGRMGDYAQWAIEQLARRRSLEGEPGASVPSEGEVMAQALMQRPSKGGRSASFGLPPLVLPGG